MIRIGIIQNIFLQASRFEIGSRRVSGEGVRVDSSPCKLLKLQPLGLSLFFSYLGFLDAKSSLLNKVEDQGTKGDGEDDCADNIYDRLSTAWKFIPLFAEGLFGSSKECLQSCRVSTVRQALWLINDIPSSHHFKSRPGTYSVILMLCQLPLLSPKVYSFPELKSVMRACWRYMVYGPAP